MKIDPSYLGELSKLSFRIKRKVFDKYVGDDVSKNTGDGLTFKDHSPYVLGDDVRNIDWKAYARTQELFVKRYEADRNVTVHTLLDASASMNYGKKGQNKFEYAAKLALAIAYVLGKHQGRVRFATFAEKLREAKYFSGSASLQSMLMTLEKTKVDGETNFFDSMRAYKSRMLKGKSSVILFSDFLTSADQIEEVLTLLGRSHVTLVHIAHNDELNFNFKGDYKLTDMETEESMQVHVSPRFMNKYKSEFQTHLDQIKFAAEAGKMEMITINTSDNIMDSFMKVWEQL